MKVLLSTRWRAAAYNAVIALLLLLAVPSSTCAVRGGEDAWRRRQSSPCVSIIVDPSPLKVSFCRYLLLPRGGSSSAPPEAEENDGLDDDDETHSITSAVVDASTITMPSSSSSSASTTVVGPSAEADSAPTTTSESPSSLKSRRRRRRASDVVHVLFDSSPFDDERYASYRDDELRESRDLRRLIMERTQEQLDVVHEALVGDEDVHDVPIDEDTMDEAAGNDHGAEGLRLPDPRRLLSYLSPKIPSIRHSPDASLRIQCGSESLDPGTAASLVAAIARVVVVRDRSISQLSDAAHSSSSTGLPSGQQDQNRRFRKMDRHRQQQQLQRYRDENMSHLLVKERRFEQLVECLVCGVDMKRQLDTPIRRQRPRIDSEADAEAVDEPLLQDDSTADIDAPTLSYDATTSTNGVAHDRGSVGGLSGRDAIRAAWGLSLLVGSQHPHDEELGGVKVLDLLVALSLLVRDRLLEQAHELRTRDLSTVRSDVDGLVTLLSEDLARDTAAALWAFSCVRACTGLHFGPLFETGCTLLCQDPIEMRKRSQGESVDVGASDIVDRLAKAEDESPSVEDASTVASTDSMRHTTSSDVSRDTLLDFLSPNEVTDVLWALALHGSRSHDSTSQEDVVLSESAATLRDLICDRLIVWLHAERDQVLSVADDTLPRDPIEDQSVDVVEPSSSGRADSSRAAGVESLTIASGSSDSEVHSVKVLDAAAVLEAETNQQGDRLSVRSTSDSDERILKSISKPHPSRDTSLRLFSPRDLCSIAWAVAELHDSLQPSVTQLVKTMFVELGDNSLRGLEGRDLSNLAWAIAKSPGAVGSSDFELSTRVVTWISEVLVPVEEDGKYINVSKLARLQPPEIGRLVWAVTTIQALANDVQVASLSESSSRLALAALSVAKENFSEFGTEDLARVAWGFLELCDAEAILSVPSFATALGKVLSMIKSSLLDWESGALRSQPEESKVSRNPFSFASFFGRARFLAQLLDQRNDEPQAEEGDEFSLSFLTKKSLPLLKDLPLDPSTLCKITSSFSRLRVQGGEVFARVALRLLTSRSGRLLRECPMSDLVRLCETVATQGGPLGRERISLFVRKLVHLFNTEWDSNHSFTLLSSEVAVLIWSLGELGVKCVTDPGPEGTMSAHRRLQLVGHLPLDDVHVQSLSTSNCVKLLIGFMSTHLALIRPDRASDVLSMLIDRAAEVPGKNIGLLAEAVAKLRHLVSDAHQRSSSSLKDDESNATAVNGMPIQSSEPPVPALVETSDTLYIDYSNLITACDQALQALADAATKQMSDLSAEEIRRVISVYTLTPFRADELVAAASREVGTRLDRMDALPPLELSMDSQLRALGSEARSLLRLFNVGEAPGLGATIRKGLTSFFRGQEKVETTEAHDASDEAETERLRSLLVDIASLSERVHILSVAAGVSVEDSCRVATQRSAFELGRCQDLIEHYKRIDFTTGARESRHVHDDKRVLAKQVLSRLLP